MRYGSVSSKHRNSVIGQHIISFDCLGSPWTWSKIVLNKLASDLAAVWRLGGHPYHIKAFVSSSEQCSISDCSFVSHCTACADSLIDTPSGASLPWQMLYII